MTATWKVTNLDYYTSLNEHTNVVYIVHWSCEDEDADGNIGRCIGTVSIPTDDLSSFTTYEDITEEQAVGWAKNALGADTVTEMEATVASEIAEKANPTIGSGAPWIPVVSEIVEEESTLENGVS